MKKNVCISVAEPIYYNQSNDPLYECTEFLPGICLESADCCRTSLPASIVPPCISESLSHVEAAIYLQQQTTQLAQSINFCLHCARSQSERRLPPLTLYVLYILVDRVQRKAKSRPSESFAAACRPNIGERGWRQLRTRLPCTVTLEAFLLYMYICSWWMYLCGRYFPQDTSRKELHAAAVLAVKQRQSGKLFARMQLCIYSNFSTE